MLKDWLNKKHLGKNAQAKLARNFAKAKPFPHLFLKDFLKKEKASMLLKELSNINFEDKESDLFKLKQSKEFVSVENKQLREFRDFFASKEFIDFMQSITCENLKVGVVDCAGSIYEDTCFLLPHDDQLEGRSIAYVFYLSTLNKSEGGSLGLYSSKNKKPIKIAKRIQPEFNSFIFFKVSDISFHEVEEITSKKSRVSINGWLHGK